ncbi:MAG TPA: DUF4229 domain-containing protein [Mycobacteriales bacterium]|nr:DUF4229 domain-containing protein [Mycobacteriales bacterium]
MLRAFAVYTALRALLLVGCLGLLLVLGVPGLLAVAGALLLSSVLSLLLLRTQRDAFVDALQRRRAGRADEQARLRQLLDDGSGS